jgi:hypothetical protein
MSPCVLMALSHSPALIETLFTCMIARHIQTYSRQTKYRPRRICRCCCCCWNWYASIVKSREIGLLIAQLTVSLSLSLSFFLSHSLTCPLFVSINQSIYKALSLSLMLSLALIHTRSLTHFLYLYFSLSISFSVCVYLFLFFLSLGLIIIALCLTVIDFIDFSVTYYLPSHIYNIHLFFNVFTHSLGILKISGLSQLR